MRAKKIVKKSIKIILLAMLFGVVYSFFFTVYENVKVDRMLEDFKERGQLVNEVETSYSGQAYTIKYWEVPRVTTNEKNDQKNVFSDKKKLNLGVSGDIFVTRQSPFPNIPIFHQFMSYYYGGHAALKYDDSKYAEATGYPDDFKEFIDTIFHDNSKDHALSPTLDSKNVNYWMMPSNNEDYFEMFYRSRFVGLRVANPFSGDDMYDQYDEFVDTAIESALEKIENKYVYNFLFFLNMRKKYYCTDYISRVFDEAFERYCNNKENYESKGYAKHLNDDGFITSVNDLILSKETFIRFYVEINEEDGKIVQNIYYLSDVE